jgi:hypothetical protein
MVLTTGDENNLQGAEDDKANQFMYVGFCLIFFVCCLLFNNIKPTNDNSIEWKYEGEWQDGIRHGKGSWEKYEENTCVEKYLLVLLLYIFFFSLPFHLPLTLLTAFRYAGEWKDDMWWGYGTVIYRSGYLFFSFLFFFFFFFFKGNFNYYKLKLFFLIT